MTEHTQRADGRYLFARRKVIRDVLGNFSAYYRHLTDIRLFKPEVLYNGQKAVLADCAGNIQFALVVERQLDNGVHRVASDIALTVRGGEHSARRALPFILSVTESSAPFKALP